MVEQIRNERDLSTAREHLKVIYRDIIRLVLQKEETEDRIEEYLGEK